MNSYFGYLRKSFINIPGYRTNRKLVVIESDDWGSIRMDSKEAYEKLLARGYPVHANPFNRYDILETNEDIELLLETLNNVKDKNGHPAIITLNCVVANPDFDKIKQSDYSKYFHELIPVTYAKYPSRDRVMLLFQTGVANKLLKPQFHGREHLNIKRWLDDLKSGHQALLDAFAFRMFTLHFENKPMYYNEYLDSLDFDDNEQLQDQLNILSDGYRSFTSIWNQQSESFIANCYVWNSTHEDILNNMGVKYIQGISFQFQPIARPGYHYKRIYHFQGQKNKNGQIYLVRNAFFEPYKGTNFDTLGDCLKRIELAFRWGKPSIISTHRINYVGTLDEKFRDNNLRLLARLLKQIVKQWPDVEFIASDYLGSLIEKKK